jgi:hypothetical protein
MPDNAMIEYLHLLMQTSPASRPEVTSMVAESIGPPTRTPFAAGRRPLVLSSMASHQDAVQHSTFDTLAINKLHGSTQEGEHVVHAKQLC